MARETEGTDPAGTRAGPGGTPEGHTPEAPAPDEFGKKGTPAAGLSPEVPHAADAMEAEGEDAEDHGHAGEADKHGAEPLGPIDWPAWGASAFGVIVALLIAAALAVPTLRM